MFIKAFKQKSNLQLKGSEKKKLRARVLSSFPALADEDLSKLFSTKTTISAVRAVTHTEENVMIYTVDKRPMFFEWNEKIVPTVYALWELPHMIPNFTTFPDVLPKLSNGADLMLPGKKYTI